MAKISFTEAQGGTLYKCLLLTHECEAWEGEPLPLCACEAFGLTPTGADAEGNPTGYQRQAGSTLLEFLLTKEQRWIEGKQAAHAQASIPTWGNPASAPLMVMRRGVEWIQSKDDTCVPDGFDWRLDVRPDAVKECRLELRADYIEQKLPATTKAAYRGDEHRRATILVEKAEKGRQGSRPFPRPVPVVRGRV